MDPFIIPEHTRQSATGSGLRLHACLDRAQDTLHIYVRPLLSDEHLLLVQVTRFDPSEPSDHLFEAAIFEGERVNRDRLGLNQAPRNG